MTASIDTPDCLPIEIRTGATAVAELTERRARIRRRATARATERARKATTTQQKGIHGEKAEHEAIRPVRQDATKQEENREKGVRVGRDADEHRRRPSDGTGRVGLGVPSVARAPFGQRRRRLGAA
mmetsp:Transcript_6029/g.23920  ORF Transcript_6029/g.23920 Transcript_6029/m.23920 type:complete len:126 (-) Transcript_6029:128-505(-)